MLGLLTGTSEEIFFRGLLQTMLVAGWPAARLFRGKIPLAAIVMLGNADSGRMASEPRRIREAVLNTVLAR